MTNVFKASDYADSHDVMRFVGFGSDPKRASLLAAILAADTWEGLGTTWKVDPAAGTVTRVDGSGIVDEVVYSDGAGGYDMVPTDAYDYVHEFHSAQSFTTIGHIEYHMGAFLDEGKPFLFQSVIFDEYPEGEDDETENIGWLFFLKTL